MGYDQDQTQTPTQQPDQDQAQVAAPQPARPPGMRWVNGGPGVPNLIGNGESVVVTLEVDGAPGSSVDVFGVVRLAKGSWCATGKATIPPQGGGPGFAVLVFQSMPSDLSMPGGMNDLTLTATGSDGGASRQDTMINVVNMPSASNPN